MIPSTPRSSSRAISSASSIVHTCTCMPRRCAASTKRWCRRSRCPDSASAPARTATGAGPSGPPCDAPAPSCSVPIGPSDVHTPGSERVRTRSSRSSLNAPMHTRSTASHFCEHLDQRLDRAVVLRVDVDAHVGPGAEQVLEQRDRLAAVDLAPRARPTTAARRSTPVAVGDPVEHVVVEREQHAVGGHVHVGLDVAVAERTACSNAGIVFSGTSLAPPRWANGIGPGQSRNVKSRTWQRTLPSRCQRRVSQSGATACPSVRRRASPRAPGGSGCGSPRS